MNTTLRRVLTCTFAAATLAAPAVASANSGYVCSTFMVPGDTHLGDEGYVSATYYSGPNCTGSYLGGKTYCSPGRVYFTSACAESATYLYHRADLNALFSALSRAAEWGQRIWYGTTTCASGSTHCGSTVYFYGN